MSRNSLSIPENISNKFFYLLSMIACVTVASVIDSTHKISIINYILSIVLDIIMTQALITCLIY